jgi:hypothetical protein
VILKRLSGRPGQALVGLVLLAYAAVALAPFRWAPPRRLLNAATAGPDGVLFPAAGLAYTREAPEWIERAAGLGRLRLELRLRTYSVAQSGPARIFTISRDVKRRNLTLGQEGPDLDLRLRRPGSSLNGEPPYTLPGVLADAGWHEIEVVISSGSLRVAVDGRVALTEAIPEQSLAQWDRRHEVALGNELTGFRPWRGEVARAVVEVGGERVDYARPGLLELPAKFWAFEKRLAWYPFGDGAHFDAIKDWVANLICFIPLGFLLGALGGRRGSWCRALAVCALASLVVEVAQVFFSRAPASTDWILNTLGGAAGAGMARWLVGRVPDDPANARGLSLEECPRA